MAIVVAGIQAVADVGRIEDLAQVRATLGEERAEDAAATLGDPRESGEAGSLVC